MESCSHRASHFSNFIFRFFFFFLLQRPKRNKARRHFYYRLRNPNWNPIPIDYFFFLLECTPLHWPLKNPHVLSFLSSLSLSLSILSFLLHSIYDIGLILEEFIARNYDSFMTSISLKIARKLYEERYYRDIFSFSVIHSR